MKVIQSSSVGWPSEQQLNPVHQDYLQEFRHYVKILGYANYHSMMTQLKGFFVLLESQQKHILDSTAADIELYYNYLHQRPNLRYGGHLSGTTIKGYLYVIQVFFNYLLQIGAVEKHPMSALKFSYETSLPRAVLTKEEIAKLYAACDDLREQTLLHLFYGCGLRRNEAAMLNLKDVDVKGGWLYVRQGKGKKRRVIPLSNPIRLALEEYRYQLRPYLETYQSKANDRIAFVLNKRGGRMTGGAYWSYFKAILKRTKISKKISLHHLRHSIATHLLAEGMPFEQVRDFLGHEFLETTQIYTRISQAQINAIIH